MKSNTITLISSFTLLLLLSCLESIAQNIVWERSLGGTQTEYGFQIIPTVDDGLLMIGSAESTNGDVLGNNGPAGTSDIWVLKLDAQGTLEWQRNYGGSQDDFGRSIAPTADGGYILTGATDSDDGDVGTNNGSRDAWVIKTDAVGNLEWERSLGGPNWDFSHSIQQTPDLGYILLGISSLTASSSLDYIVYKLDRFGNEEWTKRYGGSDDEYSTMIQPTRDQGYIMAGRSRSDDDDVSNNYGDYDFWIVKIDPLGNLQWEKNYGGSGQERANALVESPDGGFLLVGSSQSNDFDVSDNYGEMDCWIVKIDPQGNIQWTKNYGGSTFDAGYSVDLTTDGGYVIAGASASSDNDVQENKGAADYWLFKIDASGNLLWEKTFGGTNSEVSYSVKVIDEGSYVLTGQSRSWNGDISNSRGGADLWVVKVEEDLTSLPITPERFAVQISPNPSSGNFSIQLDATQGPLDLTIFDGRGSVFFSQQAVVATLDLQAPPGIYWIEVSQGAFRTTQKVLVF